MSGGGKAPTEDRVILVSPVVSVLINNAGYRCESGAQARIHGATAAQHKALATAATAFADALATVLGKPTTIETTEIPDFWPPHEDFEPQCRIGLPDGWDWDRYEAWAKKEWGE